jgi:hypothetical protein
MVSACAAIFHFGFPNEIQRAEVAPSYAPAHDRGPTVLGLSQVQTRGRDDELVAGGLAREGDAAQM